MLTLWWRAESTMMGTLLHPRMPRIDLDAVDAREAEIEQDHVGVAVGGHVQPLLAGAGHHHLVARGP